MKGRLNLQDADCPILHQLIDSFLDSSPYNVMRPESARGRCVSVSSSFVSHCLRAGHDAWMPLAHSAIEPYPQLTPECLGYTDRLNAGCSCHHWACVRIDETIWGIDLTASQYGYNDVQVLCCAYSADPLWAQRRVWIRQVPDPITSAQIVANRLSAGFDEHDARDLHSFAQIDCTHPKIIAA